MLISDMKHLLIFITVLENLPHFSIISKGSVITKFVMVDPLSYFSSGQCWFQLLDMKHWLMFITVLETICHIFPLSARDLLWQSLLCLRTPTTAHWFNKHQSYFSFQPGARCSSEVRAFAHGAMGRRIDPSWGGPIELFLVPASAPRLV